jgi:hypothetical protein
VTNVYSGYTRFSCASSSALPPSLEAAGSGMPATGDGSALSSCSPGARIAAGPARCEGAGGRGPGAGPIGMLTSRAFSTTSITSTNWLRAGSAARHDKPPSSSRRAYRRTQRATCISTWLTDFRRGPAQNRCAGDRRARYRAASCRSMRSHRAAAARPDRGCAPSTGGLRTAQHRLDPSRLRSTTSCWLPRRIVKKGPCHVSSP